MNSITVICPNSRRCVVKVAPSTQLRKILEEACLKQGFDISIHQLKHQNHILDLALPLRLTGLPNNATVEMVQRTDVGSGIPVQIHIALQLPNGSRFMQEFSNKANLLDVLYEFSQKSAQNLVKCTDGQIPCCAYMNKEYRGEAELRLTTLEAMGITGGRCLIRYFAVNMSSDEISKLENRLAEETERKKKLEKVYETRKTENERRMQLEIEREENFERQLKTKHEADTTLQEFSQETNRNLETTLHTTPLSSESLNQNAIEYIAESDRRSQTSRLHQLQSLLNQVNTSLATNTVDFLGEQLVGEDGRIHISDLETTAQVANDQHNGSVCNSITSSSEVSYLAIEKCNRMPVIIKQDLESTEHIREAMRKQDDIDDQFFELTVNDVQSIRRDLRAQAGVQEQRALLPKAYIADKNKRLKEESYKHTVIRFNCADKTIIQAQFISREPVSRLFEFIVENLKNAMVKFDLCLVNQRLQSTVSKNLIEVGVAPKSSLYIRFHSPENTFAAHFVRDKFCEIPMSEADELSKEWLSVNSIYQPYIPIVANTGDIRPSGKRQSESTESDAGSSKLEQKHCSGNLPKWFKKS
uniref:TUG-UBL1 domain-containing protein n=1 Tax=Onchocerca volvulus TaxID=6282 RepID=A0A8R1TLU7_ONCVO